MQLPNRTTLMPMMIGTSLLLAACGGGGSSSSDNDNTSGSSSPQWVQGTFANYSTLANQCSVPLTQKLWLRSWSNDTYLWYDEIIDRDPAPYSVAEYFDLLKTNELSDTGNEKDNFHFSMSTEEWELLNGSGASVGYGMELSLRQASTGVSRQVTVAYNEPNSPASEAGVSRGAIIVSVDGVSVANANDSDSIDILNAGLFPSESGQQTVFIVRDLNAQTDRSVTLTAQTVVSTPVQNTKTIQTANGKVGYLQFNSHIATAEKGLYDAMTTLSNAQVDDLVIDIRYNGGGLLAIASQLAYMVAGDSATENHVFERTSFNDKYPTMDPVTGQALTPMPFINESLGFNTSLLRSGVTLPTLNLNRVFVLTTSGTCSASEALMNALRGIDVEVIQLGDTTCGKPYGFYPTDNCDTTYFTIQFKGVNDKGFGEYSDGFVPSTNPTVDSEVPGCALDDDLTHALGDTDETLLSAALYYRDNNSCPATATAIARAPAKTTFIDPGFMLQDTRNQNVLQNNRILTPLASEQ
ncbi:peptidase [Shewanella inventionis]|uniref:Peptidase S41 n=1 Tax=Shewanella inventionis TaxID=1738770 RepID=A0ABQ1JP96_9GAMM|nr:S41 family peptidase [Shewanella inventionis]MCL1159382.1 S41 family peptidase [Shewanella inventionis]UAL44137.1 peptidase [Shewanella inventionis]GGB72087.1 peptidase S41 [Shewanella inventionis]